MNTEQETINIKKDLRSAMNGALSAQMRQAGMPYRLAFGVELPRLQAIAAGYPQDRRLAQRLWNENIRECKLLACMLMPPENFVPDLADIWADEIPTAEVAQIMAMSLLRHVPHAAETAFRWIASDNYHRQLCGFLCLARLLREGAQPNARSAAELRDQARALAAGADLHLKKAIAAALAALTPEKAAK